MLSVAVVKMESHLVWFTQILTFNPVFKVQEWKLASKHRASHIFM